MQRVACFVRDDARLKRPPHQREVADQIERLVAPELIREAQRAVHHRRVVEHDGIIERAAAYQAHRLHPGEILHEAERPRRGQFAAEGIAVHGELHILWADRRMIVVNETMNAEFIGGINADAAVSIGKFERLEDTNVAPLAAQPACARARKEINERLGRAVEDGQLEGVEFDINVVHAAGVKSRENVLGSRKQHALLHQACGIAHARDIANMRFDLEVIEVHPAKNDAGIGWCGDQSKTAMHGRVQTSPFGFDGALNCDLVWHPREKGGAIRANRRPVHNILTCPVISSLLKRWHALIGRCCRITTE